MPLNQHFPNAPKPRPRKVFLVVGKARIRLQDLQLLNYHSSVPLVTYIKCQWLDTGLSTCVPMFPAWGPLLAWVSAIMRTNRVQVGTDLRWSFLKPPMHQSLGFSLYSPCWKKVPSTLWLGYTNFMPGKSSQQTFNFPCFSLA